MKGSSPFDPAELVRWAEHYGHPETWCKKAQQLDGQLEKTAAENRRLREALAELRHTAGQREFSNEFVGRITRDVLHDLGEF